MTLAVAGHAGVPTTGASAVIVNLTVVNSPGSGWVTAYPSGSPQPLASNLNVDAAGETRPNMATVPLGPDGSIKLWDTAGGDLLADMLGYVTSAAAPSTDSGRFVAVSPQRFLDTRTVMGGPAPVAPNGTITTTPVGHGVPAGAGAAVTNLTATASTGPGYITAFPAGQPRPVASNLNVTRAGQTIANQAIVKLGSGSGISLFDSGGGHLIGDVFGWFTS
jgi:hypothetical protein